MTRIAIVLAALAALLALLLAPPVYASGGGAAPEGEQAAHGSSRVNLWHGWIAEREGVKPSVLWRPKGTPPPLLAMLLNTLILGYLLFRFARRPVTDALKKRKTSIMHGIDEASRMRDDAADRLAEFEDKLSHVDDEIERVKREMRAAGEAERVRILAEAKDRRLRMEREASLLIEQELKAAREELLVETVASAIKSAQESLSRQVTDADQQRMADEYLRDLDNAVINTRGGKA